MESVLTISNGTLSAIVWLNMATRTHTFFKTEVMSMDEIKSLLDATVNGELYEANTTRASEA